MRPNPGRWPIERMRLPELGTVPGGDGREGTLPLAARTGLHAFLRRPAESASGVRRESRFRDANGVRDPNVPEFALRAELVDGGGANPKKTGDFANEKSPGHTASCERADCNSGVTRRLKSPAKSGERSVLTVDRFPIVPDGCEPLPTTATPSSLLSRRRPRVRVPYTPPL